MTRVPWNKGIQGIPRSMETRRKISETLKGRSLSEEHKRKLSEAHRGKPKSEEWRKSASKKRKGRSLSEEHKRKIGEATKKRWQNPDYRIANTGRKYSDEARKRMSEGRKRSIHNKVLFEELENLRKQGFRCIVTSIKPIPDAIAIKEGKVYAVEIEIENIRPPDYSKYNGITYYDDVFWIFKGRQHGARGELK